MVETKAPPRLVRFLGISVVLMSMPACQSLGGKHGQRTGLVPPDSANVVYRPAYEWPGTKPLYPSGYAGADYGPMRPRRTRFNRLAPVPPAGPEDLTISQGSWDGE